MDDTKWAVIAQRAGIAIGLTLGMAMLFSVVALVMAVLTFIFVSLFRYDYVTVTSVIFLLWCGLTTLAALISLPRQTSNLGKTSSILSAVALPLFVAQSLSLYEHWTRPFLSDQFNLVAWYRDMVGAPLRAVAEMIGHIGPAAAAIIGRIEHNELLVTVVGGVLVTLIARPLGELLSPRRKTAAG